MIKIEKLRPDHFPDLRLQAVQETAQGYLTEQFGAEMVAQKGVGWAAVRDGQVIGAAGIVEVWKNRALGWALFSDDALSNFVLIHRVAKRVLCECPWRRVEIAVDVHHQAGIRWAERLGFKYEGEMRAYTIDGRDCFLYAKVKE